MMIVSGIFWNGGPQRVTGKVVREYRSGVTVDDGWCTYFIVWRYMFDDLFIPLQWSENIKMDRAKWK